MASERSRVQRGGDLDLERPFAIRSRPTLDRAATLQVIPACRLNLDDGKSVISCYGNFIPIRRGKLSNDCPDMDPRIAEANIARSGIARIGDDVTIDELVVGHVLGPPADADRSFTNSTGTCGFEHGSAVSPQDVTCRRQDRREQDR